MRIGVETGQTTAVCQNEECTGAPIRISVLREVDSGLAASYAQVC